MTDDILQRFKRDHLTETRVIVARLLSISYSISAACYLLPVNLIPEEL